MLLNVALRKIIGRSIYESRAVGGEPEAELFAVLLMPPMPLPPMPPMATTTKRSPATESAEKQAAPKQAETTSSVGRAPAAPQVRQAASADSDLPELKALGQRWGLW